MRSTDERLTRVSEYPATLTRMATTAQTIDQIRKMPPGEARIKAIGEYITAGEEKIREARKLRDSDVRELVKKLGPTGAAKASDLGIHLVKAISRGSS